MGKLKNKIDLYLHQKRINSLSTETQQIISQLCNPKVEQKMKSLDRLNEVTHKIQKLIDLEQSRQTKKIDRQLERMNSKYSSLSNGLSRRM